MEIKDKKPKDHKNNETKAQKHKIIGQEARDPDPDPGGDSMMVQHCKNKRQSHCRAISGGEPVTIPNLTVWDRTLSSRMKQLTHAERGLSDYLKNL